MAAPLSKTAKIVTGAFLISGTAHLVKPELYEPLMPEAVPAHREVIQVSGVLELLGAAGMLLPKTRRAAGVASAVLLVAVYPGNIKMAVDAAGGNNTAFKTLAFARLPLQFPMIRAAWRAGR